MTLIASPIGLAYIQAGTRSQITNPYLTCQEGMTARISRLEPYSPPQLGSTKHDLDIVREQTPK